MQPGALPDGGEASSRRRAINIAPRWVKIWRQGPALFTPIRRGRRGSEKTPRWILGRS